MENKTFDPQEIVTEMKKFSSLSQVDRQEESHRLRKTPAMKRLFRNLQKKYGCQCVAPLSPCEQCPVKLAVQKAEDLYSEALKCPKE